MKKGKKMPPRKQTSGSDARSRTSSGGGSEERWMTLFHSLGRIDIVLLIGAVLLLLVLIYTIQTILSPFLLAGAILFLLYPLRGYQLAKKMMWLTVILFGLWFFHAISGILAPFVLSLVVAYVLNPVVSRVEQWGVPRWITSLILILLFLGLLTLVLFFVLPVALSQLEGILDSASKFAADLKTRVWNTRVMHLLDRYGISSEELKSTLTSHFAPRLEDIVKALLQVLLTLASNITQLVTQIFYIILVPFLTFYILMDFPKIVHRFKMLFPASIRDRVSNYTEMADRVIGLYLRGALAVAFLQGVLVMLLFSIFGIKYALVLGIVAAVLDLVPYFGLIITLVLSALVALFSDPPTLPKVISAVASIGLLHLLEVSFLSPRIVGSRVGLHPLLIIFSLLVFYYFLGFVGLLIAVPTAALIIIIVKDWEARKRGIPLEAYHGIKDKS